MLIKKKHNLNLNEQKKKKKKIEKRILVWLSMCFVESPTGEYLEKLAQLCSGKDKNKKRKQSKE